MARDRKFDIHCHICGRSRCKLWRQAGKNTPDAVLRCASDVEAHLRGGVKITPQGTSWNPVLKCESSTIRMFIPAIPAVRNVEDVWENIVDTTPEIMATWEKLPL